LTEGRRKDGRDEGKHKKKSLLGTEDGDVEVRN